MEECDKELSALQALFDALKNGEWDGDAALPSITMEASENSVDDEAGGDAVEAYNEMRRRMERERHNIAVLLGDDLDEAQ